MQARELADAVNQLVAPYHDAEAPGGREHRLVTLAYPKPVSPSTDEQP